tara:strand:- start:89 stop:1105 length:1017 start_codon:yes stop_codon:yes gene_type:complete
MPEAAVNGCVLPRARGGELKPVIKQGARGEAVKEAQLLLLACGFAPGPLDGVFGPKTHAAVIDYQEYVRRLKVDGIIGPATWGALAGCLVEQPEEPKATAPPYGRADDATWAAWLDLVDLVTSTPAKYAPGRGGFDSEAGAWIIRNKSGNYPHGGALGCYGFVCSTWTNFVAGFLTRAGADYTPTGGMPALSLVMESSADLHPVPGLPGASFRGYGPHAFKIAPEIADLPLASLHKMRADLPTFLICAQASRRGSGWNYHHTCVLVVAHRAPGVPMHRIAADGWRGKTGFSRTPMVYKTIDAEYIARHDSKHRLRCYGLNLDKIQDRPLWPVRLEGAV